MFNKFKPLIPFIGTAYLATACLLTLYPPWQRGYYVSYAWLWQRQSNQTTFDWGTLLGEQLALLLAWACMAGILYCLILVYERSRRFWNRLLVKVAVPIVVVYLIAAIGFAIHAKKSDNDVEIDWSSFRALTPQQLAAQQQQAPVQLQPGDYEDEPKDSYWSTTPPAGATGVAAVTQSAVPTPNYIQRHRLLLEEIALLLTATGLYFGLLGFYRKRHSLNLTSVGHSS